MNKAYSKAAKRRAKKALPELAPVEKQGQHRTNGKFARKEDDPRKTAIEARKRQLGWGSDQKSEVDPTDPFLEHPLGYVVNFCAWGSENRSRKEKINELRQVWQEYSQAERTYRIRILGITGGPSGSKDMSAAEPVSVSQAMSIDVRTDAEKDRAASNNWMHWQGLLGIIPRDYAAALRHAERGTGKPLWHEGRPTDTGLSTYYALIALKKAILSK